MIRPNREDYKLSLAQFKEVGVLGVITSMTDYIVELEIYCDELEKSCNSLGSALDDAQATIHYLEE